eukprot:6480073-Prorocentrum_lima.AAC.1
MTSSLVGSEMCIRDRLFEEGGRWVHTSRKLQQLEELLRRVWADAAPHADVLAYSLQELQLLEQTCGGQLSRRRLYEI